MAASQECMRVHVDGQQAGLTAAIAACVRQRHELLPSRAQHGGERLVLTADQTGRYVYASSRVRVEH